MICGTCASLKFPFYHDIAFQFYVLPCCCVVRTLRCCVCCARHSVHALPHAHCYASYITFHGAFAFATRTLRTALVSFCDVLYLLASSHILPSFCVPLLRSFLPINFASHFWHFLMGTCFCLKASAFRYAFCIYPGLFAFWRVATHLHLRSISLRRAFIWKGVLGLRGRPVAHICAYADALLLRAEHCCTHLPHIADVYCLLHSHLGTLPHSEQMRVGTEEQTWSKTGGLGARLGWNDHFAWDMDWRDFLWTGLACLPACYTRTLAPRLFTEKLL